MKKRKRLVIGILLLSLTVFATGCATVKPSEQAAGSEVKPAEAVTETSSTNETLKDAATAETATPAPETATPAPEAGSANEAPKEQ